MSEPTYEGFADPAEQLRSLNERIAFMKASIARQRKIESLLVRVYVAVNLAVIASAAIYLAIVGGK